MRGHLFKLTAACCVVGITFAAHADVVPGEYVPRGGWGRLTIEAATRMGQRFSLHAEGANGHTCYMTGAIDNDRIALDNLPPNDSCDVRFEVQGRAVDVSSDQAPGCHDFCGVRAGFVGTYFKTQAGCDRSARRETVATLLHHYRSRHFGAARAIASRLLDHCGDAMDWLESARLRNDLAITQHHLGFDRECLATLAPLIDDAQLSDADLRAAFPPTDYDNFLPIWNATRTNLGLCRTEGARR